MEDIIFQTYGTFILTLAGFVLPLITIALSTFSEGVKLLKQRYINEQKQAENNLELEFKKKSGSGVDLDNLDRTISKLKKDKKKAEKRMLYLSPDFILLKSIIALGVSLATFLLGLYFYDKEFLVPLVLIIISIFFLAWSVVIFSNSISIIVEASNVVQEIKSNKEEKMIELLTMIADNNKKGDKSLFVNQEKIQISFDNEMLTEGKEYPYSVNNKHPIRIAITNSSEYMLKMVELGFTFPEEFIIEGKSISSTYTGDKEKIIRFKHDYLQANEKRFEGLIDITSLKTGTSDITMFIKGENLKNKTFKFKIKIIN